MVEPKQNRNLTNNNNTGLDILRNNTKPLSKPLKFKLPVKPTLPPVLPKQTIADDYQGAMHVIPDVTWVWTQDYWQKISEKLVRKHPEYTTIINGIIVTLHTCLVIFLTRLIMPFPFLILFLLTIISIYFGMGIVMTMYLVWDLFRSRSGRSTPVPITTVMAPPTVRWWTQGLSGILMLFILLVLGGIMTDAIRAEAFILVIAVVAGLVLATAFPTTGQNSATNSLFVVTAMIFFIIFLSGSSEMILDSLKSLLKTWVNRKNRETNDDSHLFENQANKEYDIINQLLDVMRAWSGPFPAILTPISITTPKAMLRYIVSSANVWVMVISNIFGPGIAISVACDIQNKIKDRAQQEKGLNSLYSSVWNGSLALFVAIQIFTGNIF